MIQNEYATEMREQLAALVLASRNVVGHVTLHNLTELQKAQIRASDVLDRIEKAEKAPALYTFNFTSGGFNQVWANDVGEAISKAEKEFPSLKVAKGSFKKLATKAEQDSYYRNLPLMD